MKIQKSERLLKGLFSLDHNIRLYIPSTVSVDKKINNEQYVKDTLSLFSDLFGGATSYRAIGAWTSQAKGLVTENVTIVESFARSKEVEAGLEAVLKYAISLKKLLLQEAISLEYDNKLYFI